MIDNNKVDPLKLNSFIGKGLIFKSNCGAASVGEYNR